MGAQDFPTQGMNKSVDWDSLLKSHADPMSFEALDRTFFNQPFLIHNDGSEYGSVDKKYLKGLSGTSHSREDEEKAEQRRKQTCETFRFAIQEICSTIDEISAPDQEFRTSWNGVEYASSGEAWNASIQQNPFTAFSRSLSDTLECTPETLFKENSGSILNPESQLMTVSADGKPAQDVYKNVNQSVQSTFDLNMVDKTIAKVSADASLATPTADFNAATTGATAPVPHGFKKDDPFSATPAPSANSLSRDFIPSPPSGMS